MMGKGVLGLEYPRDRFIYFYFGHELGMHNSCS